VSEAPPFWFQRPGLLAWALSPFGFIYGRIAARRMMAASRVVPQIPVLCIGNFIVGGAGKTPTVIAVAELAKSMGMKPGFLSRGYGGAVHEATLVHPQEHNAHDVGDEPLMLCHKGPTVVSPDRVAGADLLARQDIDIVIMDDGFQNPSLHKDCSLVVVDIRRGLGNGYAMPAGPLRAELKVQMAAVSALLLIGESGTVPEVVRKAARMAKPILTADLKVKKPDVWRGIKVLAYAGIADPQKFYASLRQAGADIVGSSSFHDHHPYSNDECEDLLKRARSEGLTLVTTEKDAARLAGTGPHQEELLATSQVFKVELEFENPKMVEMLLRDTVRRAREYRIRLAVPETPNSKNNQEQPVT